MSSNKVILFIFTLCLAICFCGSILSAEEMPPLEKYEGPIKPGVTLSKDNWDQYLPELQKLLFPTAIKWMDIGIQKGNAVPIIERQPRFPQTKGQFEATVKNLGTAKIDPETHELLNWHGGCPFPNPKNSWEVLWNSYTMVSRYLTHDDMRFYSWFGLFDKDKYQKHFSWVLQERSYFNRTDIEPLGDMEQYTKSGIAKMSSLYISEPQDVRGFILLKRKYWSMTKEDEVYSYIPALKRIRRLTGGDVTDPILGSDTIPDDFEVWQQKITPAFTCKVIGQKDMLVPKTYIGWVDEDPNLRPKYDKDKHGPFYPAEWEIRPFWILEVNINDPDYIYSKRVISVDSAPYDSSQFGPTTEGGAPMVLGWDEAYDQGGRVHRANGIVAYGENPVGFRQMLGHLYMDNLRDHYSIMDAFSTYQIHKEWDTIYPLDEGQNWTIKGLIEQSR